MRRALFLGTLTLFSLACLGKKDTDGETDVETDTDEDTELDYGDFSGARGILRSTLRNSSGSCTAEYQIANVPGQAGDPCASCDATARVDVFIEDEDCSTWEFSDTLDIDLGIDFDNGDLYFRRDGGSWGLCVSGEPLPSCLP